MKVDAVVLGGGFYGTKIALALHNVGLSVVIVEPSSIMSSATRVNQARVHSGMHYPRYIETARSAAKHYRRFLNDHVYAMAPNKDHWYAIAHNSKTPPAEFERVAREIGAPIRPIKHTLFAHDMVSQVYSVPEISFDVRKLREMTARQLTLAGIPTLSGTGFPVKGDENNVLVRVIPNIERLSAFYITARYVFNCTYANLDKVVPGLKTRLKKEWCEVALCQVPDLDVDITVMDGPYWSLMGYPPTGEKALTHVTYTPHDTWINSEPHGPLHRDSNWEAMLRDVKRFVPSLGRAVHTGSLWTTRVVLEQNEENDGRPILWEYSAESPRVVSVLGSKFNSFYDAVDEIERGEWMVRGKTGVLRRGRRALVGYTGFVGSSLMGDGRWTDLSNTMKPLDPGHYSQIVCTALKGTKWWANMHPDEDFAMLTRLKRMLEKVTTDEFILISTVDAIPRRFGYPPETSYGANRWAFEMWVKDHFPKVRIIRLPALFGPGLKKNALFDLLHKRPIEVSPWSTFQWYPLTRLWSDIQDIRIRDLTDVNLVTPPLDFGWLQEEVGGEKFYDKPTVTYNVPGPYVMTLDEVKAALKEFICSQRTT